MEDKNSKSKKPIEISITLPTQAYFLSGIRDFTLNLIKNMTEFGEKWAYRFQSIVDELCNNAIEHGSKQGESIIINFKAEPKDYIQISVEDSGTGPEKMTAEEIENLVKQRKANDSFNNMIRGRGLPKIVSEWTDLLKFEDTDKGGIKVTVQKDLKNAANEMQYQQNLESTNHIVLN